MFVRCPYCFKDNTRVLDSRETENADSVRRRRECPECSRRFTTYEKAGIIELSVVKRDGRTEPFSREKLLRGILKACEKRPVRREKIERAVSEIELLLRQREKTEIPSRSIGELVVEKLKALDEVAYVRFTSVYKKFRDVSQFTEEIERLKDRKIVLRA